MKIEGFLDRHVSLCLLAEDEIKRKAHVSSGKLSASNLGSPLQWQILKSMAVERGEIDAYTLRKFARGNHVEDWYLSLLPCVLSKQEKVEYRGVVGLLDAYIDTQGFDFPVGEAPLEIKSVANAKYKRILQAGKPDRGHSLQGALYALAKQRPHFLVSYVAADDYRIKTYLLNTADWQEEVDRIIDRYDRQKATGMIPVFEPEEAWQANPKYNDYYDWATLTELEIVERMKALGLLPAKEHEDV